MTKIFLFNIKEQIHHCQMYQRWTSRSPCIIYMCYASFYWYAEVTCLFPHALTVSSRTVIFRCRTHLIYNYSLSILGKLGRYGYVWCACCSGFCAEDIPILDRHVHRAFPGYRNRLRRTVDQRSSKHQDRSVYCTRTLRLPRWYWKSYTFVKGFDNWGS